MTHRPSAAECHTGMRARKLATAPINVPCVAHNGDSFSSAARRPHLDLAAGLDRRAKVLRQQVGVGAQPGAPQRTASIAFLSLSALRAAPRTLTWPLGSSAPPKCCAKKSVWKRSPVHHSTRSASSSSLNLWVRCEPSSICCTLSPRMTWQRERTTLPRVLVSPAGFSVHHSTQSSLHLCGCGASRPPSAAPCRPA